MKTNLALIAVVMMALQGCVGLKVHTLAFVDESDNLRICAPVCAEVDFMNVLYLGAGLYWNIEDNYPGLIYFGSR